MTRQIRRIGSDPRIVAAVVAKVNENRRDMMADLSLEHQAAQRELASLGTKLRELLPNAGCGEQTMTEQMADLHQRIDRTEYRSREILRELGSLEGESVDEADLRVVLAQFEPVWEFLNSREQARIIRTLIEHIDYSGKTNRVTVSFRSPGVRGMCRGRGRPIKRRNCPQRFAPNVLGELFGLELRSSRAHDPRHGSHAARQFVRCGRLGVCPRNHFMGHMLWMVHAVTASNCGQSTRISNTRTHS